MNTSGTIMLLRSRLAPLSPISVDIQDDSALHAGHAGNPHGSGHFSLTIVAECFDGLSRLARHRRVLDALHDLIPETVHAVAIRALTPAEAAC